MMPLHLPGRLQHLWESLRTSLWFVPAVMTGAAIALATITLRLDQSSARDWLSDVGWVHSRSAAGARDLLRVVAGSMITIAGITFSIVVVALQLASQQLGPRLLRNFMRDLGNQVVLGTFIATFVYCLLVMRTIGLADEAEPTARLSVVVALLLALASLAVLIYFIHHAAASMQASRVTEAEYQELLRTIDRLYPEPIGGDVPRAEPSRPPEWQAFAPVPAPRTGYLQRVDDHALMRTARGHDVVVQLRLRPGQFVIEGDPIAGVYPADRASTALCRQVRRALILGGDRTPEQDIEFVVERLVEVALRAVSPSRNDLFTAVACIQYLTAALVRVSERHVPSPLRADADGRLRVVAPGVTLPVLVACAFDRLDEAEPPIPAVSQALDAARRRLAAAPAPAGAG
jgi:uncharacterized membrane protein